MKNFFNKLQGKAIRHGASALLGILGGYGLSSGAAEEIVAAVLGFAVNVAISHKLEK